MSKDLNGYIALGYHFIFTSFIINITVLYMYKNKQFILCSHNIIWYSVIHKFPVKKTKVCYLQKLSNPLSCLVMNKICLNQVNEKEKGKKLTYMPRGIGFQENEEARTQIRGTSAKKVTV